MLVRFPFRTALPLPQRVSALAEPFVLSLMPEVIASVFRPTCLLPKIISAVANELV
jgi:hypothetical protein